MVFQLIWILITIIMVYTTEFVGGWLSDVADMGCGDEETASLACSGASAFVRISFSLLIFHLFMLLVMLARTKTVAEFHDGCWCFKMLFVLGIFIASFYISNDPFFLNFYIKFACVLSLGFLGF